MSAVNDVSTLVSPEQLENRAKLCTNSEQEYFKHLRLVLTDGGNVDIRTKAAESFSETCATDNQYYSVYSTLICLAFKQCLNIQYTLANMGERPIQEEIEKSFVDEGLMCYETFQKHCIDFEKNYNCNLVKIVFIACTLSKLLYKTK